MGNPNGSGSDPATLGFALGPKKDDPSLKMPDGTDCTFTIDPIGDDPDEQRQKDVDAKCKAFRCDPKNAYHADKNYFDDEYNPDGTLPVIGFCDGNSVPEKDTQVGYVNTWAPGGDKSVNLGLAVDLNKNGIRDQGEPVIRSGHEPYDDCGPDKLCDADEPGFDPETNPDPSQDDYDYQLNPSGTEGNHRFDEGERYLDYGLDGVPNTAGRHIAGDPGEGDGKFTESTGLANFYANDAHSIMSRRVKNAPGGDLTDDALRRIDVLNDGGVRDLFNFASVANHFAGQIHGRKAPNGLPVKSVAFYNGFHFLPGQPQDRPNFLNLGDIRWADVADMPHVRYGDLDASRELIERDGDGQHVGTAAQLLARLETAFFFVDQRARRRLRGRRQVREDLHRSAHQAHGPDRGLAPAWLRAQAKRRAERALPRDVRTPRVRPGSAGPRGGRGVHQQLHERRGALVRDPPAEVHHRLRRRPLSHRRLGQAGVHPRHVLHELRARERRPAGRLVRRGHRVHRQELPHDAPERGRRPGLKGR